MARSDLNRPLWRGVMSGALAMVLVSGCTEGGPRDRVNTWTPDAEAVQEGDAGSDASSSPPVLASCRPVVASESLPARDAVMSEAASGSAGGVSVSDLFNRFVDHCGSCHARGANQGGLTVTQSTFRELIGADALERIRESDPASVMPPSTPFDMRTENDPVVKFATSLEQWIAAGSPDIYFPDEGSGDAPGSASPYLLDPSVGMHMTNLGNCVPDLPMIGTESEKALELDKRFEEMETFADLPRSLRDTDLFTLDGAVLASHGVISFAPAYTLWADNAKKIRQVRVPRGQSIEFNPATQHFRIPPNTRFYKTFLKKVIDLEGNERYRKMETRLIVSRPDQQIRADEYAHTALFASYKWNEAETEATLHDVAYRDGQGFTDDLSTYVVDERLEDQVLREGGDVARALLDRGARRTYAIPGADRCIHCHMGSPMHNFVLGFMPLQINRRPLGEGGVIEPAAEDELNQLERLVEYGVITGIASREDVVALEKSQGSREPRNEHELKAQGYMLGNCAHCHNPDGFPSQREKVLENVLDFMPSETGGIFQFPLDRFSPRSFRGMDQNIRVPYITPSLFDHPLAITSNPSNKIAQADKWIQKIDPTQTEWDAEAALRAYVPDGAARSLVNSVFGNPGRPLLAPWRSMIYRNVDAPFSYDDGGTIFPHMPMDTPGYDCRARRLLGSWMVSIPARRPPRGEPPMPLAAAHLLEMADLSEQPYEEIKPESSLYASIGLPEAAKRLKRFQNSERYHDCPESQLDVVAPEVASGERVLPFPQVTTLLDDQGAEVEMYDMMSPARPHYAKTDMRNELAWVQRRPDWFDVLVEKGEDPVPAAQGGEIGRKSAEAIKVVNTLRITDEARELALEPVPFGLWLPKEECAAKLAAPGIRTAGDLAEGDRPSWMGVVGPDPTAPVYEISRGQQVFNTVCSKCHGPQGDGVSALANTIADLTGSLTRVANLRDGLFGPPDNPGANRALVFQPAEGRGDAGAEDWVARYVAWMGLGGTSATIPATVLAPIGSAPVMGQRRALNFAAVASASEAANMLSVAKKACEIFLPTNRRDFDPSTGEIARVPSGSVKSALESAGLIEKNGDGALWQAVCRLHNPQFVRAVLFDADSSGGRLEVTGTLSSPFEPGKVLSYLFRRSTYRSDAQVGDHTGALKTGVQDDNLAPWCVYSARHDLEALDAYEERLGRPLPRCPDELVSDTEALTLGDVTEAEASEWAARGAANAGLLVYLYLDALAKGEITPVPAYDRCEELP